MRSIVDGVRPDRQTLLFSATMRPRVESFARAVLTSPLRLSVGDGPGGSENISQQVHVLPDAGHSECQCV